jgi:hypothetical protein
MAETATTAPLLWHYTSFKGLHGIVVEGELIASSLAYLNDTAEFQYTVAAMLPLLESRWRALRDLLTGLFFADLASMVGAVFEHVRGQGTYVTCFSQERDDLSQWRSYTPQPPGFAIGFHPGELQALADSFAFRMQTCQYPRPDELLTEIQTGLTRALAGMDDEQGRLPIPTPEPARQAFIERWVFRIVVEMSRLAERNKHPKFASEREVRLIHGPLLPSERERIEYRQSGSLIVPYIRLPARPKEGPSLIKAILIGPCPHRNAVIEATQQMCNQHHVQATVTASEVPFRNW